MSEQTPPQAEYHQLGQSGLRVSVPILGCMSFGDPRWSPWVLPEEKALPILKAAWDRGINTLSTAGMYSNGASEKIIGKFIKQYHVPREKLVIGTKILVAISTDDPSLLTFLHPELANSREYVNQGGLSRTAIFNQVNGALERLGTSYIDLLQIHRFDPTTPIEETMKALHDLVVQGKARYLGASSMRAWQFAEMNHVAEKNGWTTFVNMESEYSLLYREEEREMYEYCNSKGIGITPYCPLLEGHLARPVDTETSRTKIINGTILEKKRRESDKEIIRRVEKVASKHGWHMSQVALAWVASKTTSPIVGANSPERLDQALIRGKTLTEEETKYLEAPYEIQPPR